MAEIVSSEAIAKADALVEAHEYIQKFAGKTIVVKVGGSIMDQPDDLRSVIEDICFMASVGMRPIIIHGGGKGITGAMKKAGLEAQFVQGRRYTDERTLAIAEHVLTQDINGDIQKMISKKGHSPMGLHSLSSCAVIAKRLFLDGEEGRKVDIGFVGEVEWVNAELLNALTDAGVIPVIAPIARDKSGGKLNVNADSIAGYVAAAVKADKLILISDTHGIRLSENEDDLAPHLTKAQIEELIDSGVITEGMLPKVESSFTALAGGVTKAHIVHGRIPHAALLEVYTDTGIGTEIVL